MIQLITNTTNLKKGDRVFGYRNYSELPELGSFTGIIKLYFPLVIYVDRDDGEHGIGPNGSWRCDWVSDPFPHYIPYVPFGYLFKIDNETLKDCLNFREINRIIELHKLEASI